MKLNLKHDINNSSLSLLSQVLVVQQSPTSAIQIKEPPPSPGSPSADSMYGATGGTQIYMQVSQLISI